MSTTENRIGPWRAKDMAGHDKHGEYAVYDEATGKDVAIVYDGKAHAELVAAAPDLRAQLARFVEFAEEWFSEGMPEDWKARVAWANAALWDADGV